MEMLFDIGNKRILFPFVVTHLTSYFYHYVKVGKINEFSTHKYSGHYVGKSVV